MHIVLLILKIIGIILLILLALVLLLLFLVLFAPFCYRAEGSYYGERPYVHVRIRYLFPLLQIFVRLKDGEPEGKVKLFCWTIYDFFAPEKSEKLKNRKKDAENNSRDKVPEQKQNGEENEALQEKINDEVTAGVIDEPDVPENEPEEQTLFEKIRYFISILKKKIRGAKEALRGIKKKGIRLRDKTEETKNRIKHYYDIWQKDSTQRAYRKAKRSLARLWKSIRPKKGRLQVHFGTGDPADTGQICGYIGMVYPFIGKYVMIEPDFESKIYEGEFYLKGHITVCSFLKIAWILLFDKDIKKLRKILMN